MDEEKIVFQGKPEWAGYAVFIMIIGLALIVGLLSLIGNKNFIPLLIVVVLILILYLSRDQHVFKVTNQRIIVKKGLLTRKTSELDIKDIRSINVSQTFLQRFFNIGNIEFTSASGPIKEVELLNIANPNELKEKIRVFKV